MRHGRCPAQSTFGEDSWLEPVPYDKMKPCSLLVSVSITACVVPCSAFEDAITLSTEAVPSPAAAEAILDQTAHETTIRLGPMDVFPHAALSVAYDDNVLISHVDPIQDVEWAIAPGLMFALGFGIGYAAAAWYYS